MIYFIRHGETDYNKTQTFQGHLDIPLNKQGIVQANLALENSKSIKIDKIYYSPLSRAKQTAEIINSFHNAEMIADDRLKEIYMGSLQGKTPNKLKKPAVTAGFLLTVSSSNSTQWILLVRSIRSDH